MTAFHRLRIGAAVLGAWLISSTSPMVTTARAADPVPAAAKGDAKAKQKQVAQAKVELKTEAGTVLKSNLNLDWGKDGTLELAAGDTKHAVGIRVTRDGESNEISVTLSYGVDGNPVIEPFTFDTVVGKREVITIEDAGAIAVTVTPKSVKADEPAPAPPPDEPEEPGPGKGKIEVKPDTDDPLGGLE